MATDAEALPAGGEKKQNEALVITASSLGTVFEWYDFYLYGLLATALSHHFFAGVNETTGFILALMAFAAGFAVRPFGALRSEEHTSELQSLMRISYAVFCLKKKKNT